MSTRDEMILLPSLKAQRAPGGPLIMTRKYLEGAALFAEHWPGRVTVLVELDDTPGDDLDRTEAQPDTMGFSLETRPRDTAALAARLANTAVALGFLSGGNLGVADACEAANVPLVCTSEYAPRTERQIARAELAGAPLRLSRRLLWLRAEETRRQRLLRRLAGLQCSGTPTYDLYAPKVANPLLFFDNRVQAARIITDAELAAKRARLAEGHPLRLVFGGRMVAMKGVLDLPDMARALIARDVPFTFDIVGHGPLESRLRSEIAALGDDRIRLRPAMDFRTGWIPFLKQDADLFICCHPQGDPSSTYPEVMSCGVPIVGYDNEAWTGVLRTSGAGWRIGLGDSDAVAERVARLHHARDEIADMARRGRTFAAEHCFERTFSRRAAHLSDVCRP